MLTYLLSFIGGILTILSPCVLPVIPFVFSRADQPFRKAGLPMLVGMALAFAIFAALSVTGGHYIAQANQWGRFLALVIFAILGITLLSPKIANFLTAPLVRLGLATQKQLQTEADTPFTSLLLGASIGLLWAPCAGPILGLILAGAALADNAQQTFALLMTFAMGAATSLGLAIFAGNRVFSLMKKSFVVEELIRRTGCERTYCCGSYRGWF